MRKNSKSGRPPFKPTAAMRNRVAIGAACRMSHDALASALGISRNTLETYFEAELSQIANKKRLEVLESLFRTARKGNVSAQKAIMAMSPPGAGADSQGVLPAGKKEQANRDAVGAAVGTAWDGLLPENVHPIRKASA